MGWIDRFLGYAGLALKASADRRATVSSQQPATGQQPASDDPLASNENFRRSMGGAGNSGGWASDHREEANHNTGFNYIAVHAIATQVASSTVTAFLDGDDRDVRQSRRKSLAASCRGSFTRWKSIYGQGDKETDPLPTNHPLVRLLKKPNPYESGAQFRYRQAQQMRLTGRCLIWNVPSQLGQTCERYIIPTSMATWVMPTRDMPLGGWRVSMNGSRFIPLDDNGFMPGMPGIYMLLGATVDARQVQDIKYPHAWWLGDGWSPVMAGATFIDGANDIAVARSAHLRNGVTPAIVLSRKDEAGEVSQDVLDRAQLAFNKKYAGPYNHAKAMWAPDQTDVTVVGADAKDMAYEQGHKDFREAVFALHQVSPVAAGIQEVGTGSAYYTSMKQTRHAAIQPLCDMLAEADTEFLAPQFGDGLTVEYEAPALDDDELENKEFVAMANANAFRRNELRAKLGYPPIEGPEGEEIVGAKPAPSKPGSGQAEQMVDPESGQTPFMRKALRAAWDAVENADKEWLEGRLDSVAKRLVTLHPHGDKHGIHVNIDDDGTVLSGPHGLQGKNINNLSEGTRRHELAKAAAETHGSDVQETMSLMPHAHRFMLELHEQREQAKRDARKYTGLSVADIAKHENEYRDNSSVEGFDRMAREFAEENPQHGLDKDAHDTPAKVWELIREGRHDKPNMHSPEVADMAAQWAKNSKRQQVFEHDSDWDSKSLKARDPNKPRKFSSTQINLPEHLSQKVIEWGVKFVPDDQLTDDGLEGEPHVTVLWGLHTTNPKIVQNAVKGTGEVKIAFGVVSRFECAEFDVLKVDVSSEDLVELNKILADSCENTQTHPKYVPHCTIAYVKKGSCRELDGSEFMLEEWFTSNKVMFSGSDGKKQMLSLSDEKSLGMSSAIGSDGGFAVKPNGCSCEYPKIKHRNGSGHSIECGIHKEWEAAGGFYPAGEKVNGAAH